MSIANLLPASDKAAAEKRRAESIAFAKKSALETRHSSVLRPDLSELSNADMAHELKESERMLYDLFYRNADKGDVGMATLQEIRRAEAAVHHSRKWMLAWAAQEAANSKTGA